MNPKVLLDYSWDLYRDKIEYSRKKRHDISPEQKQQLQKANRFLTLKPRGSNILPMSLTRWLET